MTLAEEAFAHADAAGDRSIPVLETERLDAARAASRGRQGACAFSPMTAALPRIPLAFRIPMASTTPSDSSLSVNQRDGEACFVISHGGKLIGGCGIDRVKSVPEIGYWLGARYWGRGFATEAARAVIDHAFGELQQMRCMPARASAIRRRVACWRNALSSGPAFA